MSVEQHVADREWAFEALDDLHGFLDDPDFEGDRGGEAAGLERRIKELQEGKYRVVFLGAFNVGKSTLVNALLEDAYLPTVLEECTAKITHVVKSSEALTRLVMRAPATDDEISALRGVVEGIGIGAHVSALPDSNHIEITYSGNTSQEVRQSLTALVTMNADEDFPQLQTFRKKFEEIQLEIPSEKLLDDIAFVDSPGVHSISETNSRVAEEIIPRSHLVCCLLDSQSAGNVQDSAFIARIREQRHRKIFFVINKADQLNDDEIDPQGKRGPARDLLRSLDGSVPDPELFFVSSLYALLAAQLRRGAIALEELDKNNKVKIPFALQRQLLQQDDPEQGFAEYLSSRSRLCALRDRLLDYLYNENREGAILESVCQSVSDIAWRFGRPLQVKLELIRNIPKLDYLRQRRDQLTQELAEHRAAASEVEEAYAAMTEGGDDAAGKTFEGYEALAEQLLGESETDAKVTAPVKAWLEEPGAIKEAVKDGFAPLTARLEQHFEELVRGAEETLNQKMEKVERQAVDDAKMLLDDPDSVQHGHTRLPRPVLPPFQVSLNASYGLFAAAGLVAGAAAGAGLGHAFLDPSVLPEGLDPVMARLAEPALTAGAVAGAVLGLAVGAVARFATRMEALRKRTAEALKGYVDAVAFHGAAGDDGGRPALLAQVKEALAERSARFGDDLKDRMGVAESALAAKLSVVHEEENELHQEQQTVINRLQPKADKLQAIHDRARAIAEKAPA